MASFARQIWLVCFILTGSLYFSTIIRRMLLKNEEATQVLPGIRKPNQNLEPLGNIKIRNLRQVEDSIAQAEEKIQNLLDKADAAEAAADAAIQATKKIEAALVLRESNSRQQVPHSSTKPARAGPVVPPAYFDPQKTYEYIVSTLDKFIRRLNHEYTIMKPINRTPEGIWSVYYDAVDELLVPIDREYEGRTLFPVREDHSIYVSVASYRDQYCPPTMKDMFAKAAHPERLFVGLVQQNCLENCKTGVLEGGIIKAAPPDIDCEIEFCKSEAGQLPCANNQFRILRVNESESLGPAGARYLASKLWMGETYFMQIDSHMDFVEGWDDKLIADVNNAPSAKPVISHYPPPTGSGWQHTAGWRMCGSMIATNEIEHDIIRLDASGPRERKVDNVPRYAAFVAAGFFFAPSHFLAVAPFDPFLPWIFMGEELLLSIRFWTNGFDFFSPSQNIMAHIYVRRHLPKFWETVNRVFKNPAIHNNMMEILIKRSKHLAGYPECTTEMVYPATLLGHLDLYGVGSKRSIDDYYKMVGIDLIRKRTYRNQWCFDGQPPTEPAHLGYSYDPIPVQLQPDPVTNKNTVHKQLLPRR